MNKAYYEIKILDMLNNPENYKHAEENQEKRTLTKNKAICEWKFIKYHYKGKRLSY